MQYAVPIIAMIFMGVLLYLLGDAPQTIFMKLTVFPLFLLASRAIKLIFVSEASRTPWTGAFLERIFLDAMVFACLITVFVWEPELSLVRMVRGFAVTLAIFAGLNLLYGIIVAKRSVR